MTRDLSGCLQVPRASFWVRTFQRVFARPKLIDSAVRGKGHLAVVGGWGRGRPALDSAPAQSPITNHQRPLRRLLLLDVDVVSDHAAKDTAGSGADDATLHLVLARAGANQAARRRTDRGVTLRVLLNGRRGCR